MMTYPNQPIRTIHDNYDLAFGPTNPNLSVDRILSDILDSDDQIDLIPHHLNHCDDLIPDQSNRLTARQS